MSKDVNYLVEYVEDKIKPYTLNKIGENDLSVLINEFSMEDLIKAIDISYKNYIELDESCKKPTSYTGGFFLENIR